MCGAAAGGAALMTAMAGDTPGLQSSQSHCIPARAATAHHGTVATYCSVDWGCNPSPTLHSLQSLISVKNERSRQAELVLTNR